MCPLLDVLWLLGLFVTRVQSVWSQEIMIKVTNLSNIFPQIFSSLRLRKGLETTLMTPMTALCLTVVIVLNGDHDQVNQPQ